MSTRTTITPLRQRMIGDMTVRNLAPATQRAYIHAVKRFSAFFGRSPDQLGAEDVRTFQLHLAGQGVAWSSINQFVCALRFLYGVTLGRADMLARIPYGKQPQTLPEILSADEVVRFLGAVPNIKYRTALTCAYAAGLRVSEVVALEVRNIDSKRMMIRYSATMRARRSRRDRQEEIQEIDARDVDGTTAPTAGSVAPESAADTPDERPGRRSGL